MYCNAWCGIPGGCYMEKLHLGGIGKVNKRRTISKTKMIFLYRYKDKFIHNIYIQELLVNNCKTITQAAGRLTICQQRPPLGQLTG